MGYNLQGMSDYAKSNGIILIKDLILQAQSFSMDGIRVETGIKSTELFADFAIGNTYLQATLGDAGALLYSGGSTLKDISIHVVELAIKERYVKSTLESKIAQMQMRAGSDPSNPIPYNDVLVNIKAQTVGHLNDLLVWQGDVTGLTNNQVNGYITILKASTGATAYVTATGVTVPFTQTTAIASVENFVKQALAAFPVWILDGAYLYMSPTNFEIYFRAVYGLSSPVNTLTLELNAKPVQKFMVPGTNVEVLSTNGLVGNNSLIMTREFNLCLGTDLVSEDDTLSFEYLNEQQCWRLFGAYKLGPQIARTAEVVAAIA
jgi:hypothetical protein